MTKLYHNNTTQHCVTFLTREQIDYLDKMGKDYFFKYGHKLSRGTILSELVNLAIKAGIDIEELDIRDNEALCEALLRVMNHENKPNV
ncbi:MAG: hypothetical protein V1927_05215 [Candidatus Omnitrophota bacterium]